MQQAKPNAWEIIRICYNTKTDELELQRHTVEHSIPTKQTKRGFLWWKDVAYLGDFANGPGEFKVLDLKASVCKKAEMSASTLVPDTLKARTANEDHDGLRSNEWFQANNFLFFGNESFLISVRYVYPIITSHRLKLHVIEHRCLIVSHDMRVSKDANLKY